MNLRGESGAASALLVAVFGLALFCSGCGEYYRPVANPVPQPGGDPQRTAHALVVSSNGSNPGTAVVIDVSGDTNVATFAVGRNPLHAAFISGTDYVVNQGDNNINSFTLLGAGNPPNIISLPAGASPVFVAPAQSKVFVAEPGRVPPMVADIAATTNSLTTEVPVGNDPVALVATPDGTQLYCLNQADNSVSVIFPATDQVVPPIAVGISPVWGAVSSDGSRVFVVNQGSDNVSVIDTATAPQNPPNPPLLPVGAGPNYIIYQASLNRFYVTSPSDNSLSIINNNVDPNQCARNPSLCVQKVSLAGAPCNAQHPISVTALADGTRAYVADDATNSVCVLNTTSNTFTKSIPVGTAPVFIASDSNSTRVYTANSGSFDISLIQTSDDTTVKQSDGVHPLTICAGPTPPSTPCTPGFTPRFIVMTP
jgi:YVTN family beta-propeller protein